MHLQKRPLNIVIFFKLIELMKNYPFEKNNIEKIQLEKLKKLLIYSYENFSFYKQRMDNVAFNPYEMKLIEDFRKIPILEKNEYREFTEIVYKQNPSKYDNYYIDTTSGSTGTPLKIFLSCDEKAYYSAKFLRTLILNGYKITDKTFCIIPPHRVIERDSVIQKLGILRRVAESFTKPTNEIIESYQKNVPDLFYSSRAQLVQMAMYAKKHKLKLHKPKIYMSGAETLDNNSKELIQRVFGKDNLFDVYGATEFSTLAFTIANNNQDVYNFCHDTNILELNDNGRINLERGNCIITDLHNYTIPLIRYNLGDWIEAEKGENGIQVIKKITGKLNDLLTFRDGEKVPYQIFYEIMGTKLDVLQFRMIQESYDLIRLLVVITDDKDKEKLKKELISELKTELRSDVTYEVEYVENIPPDINGKLRMVISNV